MHSMKIVLDGDGSFPEMQGKKIHHVTDQFSVTALRGGMQSGKTSVALVIPLPDGSIVFAETSLALFVGAARAFVARHGDPTGEPTPAPPTNKRGLVSDRAELDTTILPNGQQTNYLVLSEEERSKGFVRPVRDTYVHDKCGSATTMGRALAETYARQPDFYSGTFCCVCGSHFPVGAEGEFSWEDGTKVGT